jgi:A/G-specific adenine glycosylase
LDAEWTALDAEARHTFTHFHLRLKIMTAKVPMDSAARRGSFLGANAFSPAALPTAMRKVFDLAHLTLRDD